MNKNLLKLLTFILAVMFLSGCAIKKYEVKSYVQDKERVDQDLNGNAGYIVGEGKDEDTNRKKTRQVYVVEVTKKVEELPDEYYDLQPSEVTTESYNVKEEKTITTSRTNKRSSSGVVIPRIDDGDVVTSTNKEVTYTDYVVEKDDTLQKIAKKFYGSYGKWMKIYEANKEAIKDPDRIKPGITIRIPQQ